MSFIRKYKVIDSRYVESKKTVYSITEEGELYSTRIILGEEISVPIVDPIRRLEIFQYFVG